MPGTTLCHHCPSTCGLTRRQWLGGAPAAAAAAVPFSAGPASANTGRQMPVRRPLSVQPILIYSLHPRRPATSFRPWGGLQTETDVAEERERIGRELANASVQAGFPLDFKPLAAVTSAEQAAAAAQGSHDATLLFAASGPVKTLEAATAAKPWNLIFVRHRSGPVYLWYEIAHARFLRKTVDAFGQPGMGVDDVVVDRYDELLSRLRALAGLKNTLGKRIVAVGGPSGWGQGGRRAPEIARDLWKLDIQTVSYDDLGQRIVKAQQNASLVSRSRELAGQYLQSPGVTLETERAFLDNAFLLREVFQDLLNEAQTDAITINNCMSTIMPMSKTTACMPLSLLNDAGYMAFCESDFVVAPSGILLHYLSGKPVFLNDPTYPHDGIVTLAHCTAPRRMDGATDEPVRILTHFESDYGAAPKVEMARGRTVTNLIPDFDCKKWVGFRGEIVDAPFLPICRSQIDVAIQGDQDRLLRETGGFHWMTGYGDYLKETGYALEKLGVQLVNLSRAATTPVS